MIKPYYQDDYRTIYHGDCLEIMPQLESVDLVVTSPPFNLGKDHHTGNFRHSAYNDNLPEEKYQQWQISILNQIYTCLSDNGSLFYQHKNRIKKGKQITPYEWIFKTPLIVKQELVWFNRSQNFDKIRFYPMTERVYWLSKSIKTQFYNNINHHDLFDRKDWPVVGTKGQHTRAFPIEFVADILHCFPKDAIILDPMNGSGTTTFAALQLNRKAIGIEIEEKYCEIAVKRLMQGVGNG